MNQLDHTYAGPFGQLTPCDGGAAIPLTKKRLTIGRSPEADIQIQSMTVSRLQCRLTLERGYWFVDDLQSRCGTKVDGQWVIRKRVDPGSRISIGGSEYILEYNPQSLDADCPPPASVDEMGELNRCTLDSRADSRILSCSMDLEQDFGSKLEVDSFSVPEEVSAALICEEASISGGLEATEPEGNGRDMVHFAVYSPRVVKQGSQFILSAWAFLEEQRHRMRERAASGGKNAEAGTKGPAVIERGTELRLSVQVDGIECDSPEEEILWVGEIANAQFLLRVPTGCDDGVHLGRIGVFSNGIRLIEVLFELAVGVGEQEMNELDVKTNRVRSIFASYSRADAPEVLQWARGAQAVGVDVFVDVLALRSGSNWKAKLAEAIDCRDLFCLFWSKSSSRSKWVEWEWRYALEHHGSEFIQPVPLADPVVVPPPRELAEFLHFDDVFRIVIDYRRRIIWGQGVKRFLVGVSVIILICVFVALLLSLLHTR